MPRKKKRNVIRQLMNPRVTLRAQTVPNKKRQADRQKCRKNSGHRPEQELD